MNTGDIMNLLNSYAKNTLKITFNMKFQIIQKKESYDTGSEVINKYLNDQSNNLNK